MLRLDALLFAIIFVTSRFWLCPRLMCSNNYSHVAKDLRFPQFGSVEENFLHGEVRFKICKHPFLMNLFENLDNAKESRFQAKIVKM